MGDGNPLKLLTYVLQYIKNKNNKSSLAEKKSIKNYNLPWM